ncbi:MAG: PAS domain-containing protein, partial [Dehalococcoidia bacterium]
MANRSGAVPRKPLNPATAPPTRWEVGLGAFAAASVDAFMLFDENLNVVGMNPAAERLAEPSREPPGAPIGKSILDLSPEIKNSPRYDEYLKVLETGEPCYAEVVSHHPQLGEKRHSVKAFKVG